MDRTTGWIVAGCMAAFLAFTFGFGWVQTYEASRAQAAAEAASPASDEAPPRTSSRFTKAQFVSEVDGKTKEQIRAEFGKPDTVHDADDSWVYFNVPVYDETAGTKVRWASIKFEGISGGSDEAADVSFE